MPRKLVRAREPYILRDPETGDRVTVSPANPIPDDDPLVKAHSWAFITDEERGAIVDATARPGQRR